MKQILTLWAVAFFAVSAGAADLDSILDSTNTITFSPALHKGHFVEAGSAAAVCALAGYQLATITKKTHLRPEHIGYYTFTSPGGAASVLNTFVAQFHPNAPGTPVMQELVCSRKATAMPVKFE